ncbi:ABC transporter substrate-binding protein [Bradyrhizobium diazoefficiens]|jgi:branched-chain amino acid transport system substrate-binding protein|nr:ABC transporter substrate-binding protein [Bradyrhizobium diazoefficiens]MBR0962711.1 ABC transporter substrate-binding protein [Bradyrhizobium diazoefficiens]MBR0976871.1 ABC transporter substrate-binding protein [Bradyrhizobium diazoefficiens]MBR1005516.1 ABC transporter substrate-binding protein [Bradyrhizobium diazoefficiens]MBR1011989.1 ABC transporter substrate-binding protein [Bradyrhizobium diazoefficiens]MBR1049330.1 ABC transporter substrate-binding protein [Bradyrhizobium diazoef
MNLKHVTGLLCAAAMSLAFGSGADAQDKVVKIGVILPMSGGTASIGAHAKAALEVATDIINNAHPELGNLPLAKNAGLAGLGGAKIEVVIADNQGNPATGQNQALRLITEEKVAAVFGAYQSGITLTSSAIAEKYGVPYLNSESVAANLTERGFKWFFRTTPIATDFARIYVDFLADIKAQGAKTDSVALVHDNTEYGSSVANTIAGAFKEKGNAIALDVAYPVNATDVQGQVLQLKDKKPDVVIMISYTSDAILFAKTMQSLDYKPAVLLADDAGYSDPSFTKAVGKISQGVFNRSSWVVGPSGSPSAIIADLYKKKSGEEMDDTVARQMQGFFVLADAIDRAGSTEPARIQAALKATDLKPEQLIIGYKGVKFDDKGQNILASGAIIQLQDGENYVSVWPKANAEKAPVLPYKGW